MDLHALSKGRLMLVTRGFAALVAGLVASNNPGLSADSIVLLLGLLTVVEGAALVRQGFPPEYDGTPVDRQPQLAVLGGVALAVGVLCVVGPGLSASTMLWVLATWFLARAVAEGLTTPARKPVKPQLLLGLATVADLALVTVIAIYNHAGSDPVGLVLFSGLSVAMWGLLHLGLAIYSPRLRVDELAVSLLTPR